MIGMGEKAGPGAVRGTGGRVRGNGQPRGTDGAATSNGRAARRAQSRSPVRRLLSDPPLLDRLTWREAIGRQTLISEDTGLMARSFGTLYGLGGLVGFLLLVLGQSGGRDELALVALSTATLTLAFACLVGYRRLSLHFFQAVALLGSLLIATAALTGPEGAEGTYSLYYVWIMFLAFFFFPLRAALAQLLVACLAYGAVLVISDTSFTSDILIATVATLGTTGAIMGMLRVRLERLAARLAEEAATDPVTSLANRRAFDERLELELARARRGNLYLSLLICDLDHFKAVNDELGHEEGDAALSRAAAAIGSAVRRIDFVARVGGEEFAALLPGADPEAAFEVAERVRVGILGAFADGGVTLTASCGVATFDRSEHTTGGQLLRAADAALYGAKREGRDRTVASARDRS